MLLSDEIIKIINDTEIFPFATASCSGDVNVVPVKFLRIVDHTTIWITDNYFEKTLKNLRENPQASFYIWAPASKKSYQIKGTVEIQQSGIFYEEMKQRVQEIKPSLPAKSLVIMRVTEIYDCIPKKA